MSDPDTLICYVHESWTPRIEPASSQRAWMDETPERFAYRCLPLSMANAHGWIVRSPCAFWSRWTGGNGTDAVEVRPDAGTRPHEAAVSIFGQGVLSFHVAGLIRTSPGTNLLVGGPPNEPVDGISPLTGLIEADWSPYSFTMNWRFTRADHWVRFEEGQPFCFFFPVPRGIVDSTSPRFEPLAADAELAADFARWDVSRRDFQDSVAKHPPSKPSDKWQKLYYRGLSPLAARPYEGHQTKIRAKPFEGAAAPQWTSPYADRSQIAAPEEPSDVRAQLRRRDWILQTQERHRRLASDGGGLARVLPPTRQEFLDELYARGRPAIIAGLASDWPAAREWTPETLISRFGSLTAEVQTRRCSNASYERNKAFHRQSMNFGEFVKQCLSGGNDTYLTAYNAVANTEIGRHLSADLKRLDVYLSHDGDHPNGMAWIGGAGTFTPLHHDLTNNLLVQMMGSKRVKLIPPSESHKLSVSGVFSNVEDLDDPARIAAFPEAASVEGFSFDLEPGDALFIPVGWWHQVRAHSFSASITYTCFLWPNDAHLSWPG